MGGSNTDPTCLYKDSSKLKDLAGDHFKFDENRRKFSKRIENTEKRRNVSLLAISPFATVFSKDF